MRDFTAQMGGPRGPGFAEQVRGKGSFLGQQVDPEASSDQVIEQVGGVLLQEGRKTGFVRVAAFPVYLDDDGDFRKDDGSYVGAGEGTLDVNRWRLEFPAGLALVEGTGLFFDVPTTPDAVPTGAADGIRIIIGNADRGLYFESGPAVGVEAGIKAPCKAYIRYYAAGNVFTYDRSNREPLQLIEMRDMIANGGIPVQTVGADDARFRMTDYVAGCEVINTPTARRVVRPLIGSPHRYANPGTRETVGIRPGPLGGKLEWDVRFPGIGDNAGALPMVAEVLVNGVSRTTLVPPVAYNEVGYATISVDLAPSTDHLVELFWPYGWPMEVVRRRFPAGAQIGGAPPRPARVLQIAGDSTSQPFYSTKPSDTWWFKTASRLAMAIAHNGYGGDALQSARGTLYGQTDAEITVTLIGVNNATAQYTVSSTRDEAQAVVQNFVAARPNRKLLVLGFLWNFFVDQQPAANTGDQYRAAIQAGVAAANAGSNVRYANARNFIPNVYGSTIDGTHPTPEQQEAIYQGVYGAIVANWPEYAT